MPSGGGHGGGGHGGGGKGHGHHEEHEEHEEHVNHEAWVIPYADMLTLLMVMFLALFATSRVDMEKFKHLADNLRTDFGGSGGAQLVTVGAGGAGTTPLEGGAGIFDGSKPPEAAAQVSLEQKQEIVKDAAEKAAQEAVDQLGEFKKALTTESNIAGLGQGLDFRLEGRGLVVTVLSDAVLFAPASGSIEKDGFAMLDVVVAALKLIPNDVVIEGHTDSRPISTDKFPSNWELSTARATSVLRYFAAAGVPADRLAAVGYGETHPVADNTTPEGQARNRRVEIVILTDVSLEPILADATDMPDPIDAPDGVVVPDVSVSPDPTVGG